MNPNIQGRLDAVNWNEAEESLSACGYVVTDPILTPEECASIVSLYHEPARFRSHIIMERHRFGAGDYKYFANPLPDLVENIRTAAYPHLAKVANEWAKAFGEKPPFPADHAAFLKMCHQRRPDQADPSDTSLRS